MSKTKQPTTEEQIMQEFKQNFIPIEAGYVGVNAHGKYDRPANAIDIMEDFIREALAKQKEALEHDHEILVKTIMQTKNTELRWQKETFYKEMLENLTNQEVNLLLRPGIKTTKVIKTTIYEKCDKHNRAWREGDKDYCKECVLKATKERE